MGFCTIKIPNSVEILEEGGFKIGSQIDTLSLECHNYFRCTARMKTENFYVTFYQIQISQLTRTHPLILIDL